MGGYERDNKDTYGFEPCPWCGHRSEYTPHKVRVYNQTFFREDPYVRIRCRNCNGAWKRKPKEQP